MRDFNYDPMQFPESCLSARLRHDNALEFGKGLEKRVLSMLRKRAWPEGIFNAAQIRHCDALDGPRVA
jgi:hypothetical protein